MKKIRKAGGRYLRFRCLIKTVLEYQGVRERRISHRDKNDVTNCVKKTFFGCFAQGVEVWGRGVTETGRSLTAGFRGGKTA